MQVVEKSSEGLSRVIAVTIPQGDLSSRLDARIAEIAPTMKLKGFRPGKVPAAHVRKMFGRELMGEIINDEVNTSSQKALDDAKLRPAAPAEITPITDIEDVVAGKADLSYEMSLEVMPDFAPMDVTSLKLSRPVHEPADKEVADAVTELASQNTTYDDKGGKAPKAAEGDQVIIDFVGKIDDEVFEGGSANDTPLVIGSGRFIPGFEDQLKGAKVGDETQVKVTFPADYGAAHLAGKDAVFDVTVKAVKAPKEAKADDDFAKAIGIESLEKLNELVKQNLQSGNDRQSRFKLKRALLDALDKGHDFPLPPRMVEAEFDGIWSQVEADKAAGRLDEEDSKKSDKKLKDDYRKIAERRVRLGLVLAELGRAAGVTVSDQEVSNAIVAEARNYPGQERQVMDFYRQNPNATNALRAPIYEEKVCDWIFEQAKVTDKKVSRDELFKDDE
ncbi:trigger factor [Brevundimonas aveniformis]|uniref:trigger factor n=1 Tax=Brevundimonas aveniformis TaxID=370977 RepID=UPI00048EFD0B|nr:trigger factor [Brevundimonas aveniformis]